MRSVVGLSIIIMILCFNLGLFIVSSSGLYSGVDIEEGSDIDNDSWSGRVLNFGILSLTGVLFGYALGALTSADPIKLAGIGLVASWLIPLYNNNYRVLNSISSSINSPIVSVIVTAFIGVQIIFIGIFLIQLTTGGWASIK